MPYFTEYGGMNMHPREPSENHPLFRAYYDFWCMMNNPESVRRDGERFLKETNWKENFYQANIPEKGQHFSRDNMWGVYFLHLIHNLPIDDLPVLKWNNEIWWHPNGWSVFLSLKYKWAKFVFSPIVHLMMKYSYRRHIREIDYTSGPCLWTLMKYFLYKELPSKLDCEAFKWYCTRGYDWDLGDHPVLLEIEKYENL